MEPDILEAAKAAARAAAIPEKAMAWAIHIALRTLAQHRTGGYGIEQARLRALAEEFEEFAH